MPLPVELGQRAHVPGSVLILIVGMAALMWFFRGFLVSFAGVCFVGLDFIHIPDGSKIFAFNSCFPCHGYV
jgi:hypothetical protein